jgi:hypothetical protein
MGRDSYTITLNMFVLVEYTATERLQILRYNVTSRQEAETMASLADVEGQQSVRLEGGRDRSTAHVALPIQMERSLEGRLRRRSA